MASLMRFGLSTHLFHGDQLNRDHLAMVADAGFDLIEVFATQTHVDYHNLHHVALVRSWLDELGLDAWSLHAPITDGLRNGIWGRSLSNASKDADRWQEAVSETRRSITAAQELGCRTVVLHLGVPVGQPIPANDNDAGAASRSLEPIAESCERAGLRLAIEVIPNELATAAAVFDWLRSDLELGPTGACLDTGHAHLTGGVPDAIERLAGDIITTHVHDNTGTGDDHLLPFDGTIDWVSTLFGLVKIGYSGPLMFELPSHGDAARTLAGAVSARRRIQAILDELTAPFPFEDA
jgi:sugar phosphate isomerase/epimerase